jgi:hypothetical protein
VLYVATAELRTFKAKRLAANERDGLGLDLADMPSGLFAIHESFGCCVSENDVSDLVERRVATLRLRIKTLEERNSELTELLERAYGVIAQP